MNNFLVCLNAVLPIFALIALGCFVRFKGAITAEERASFNTITFRYFLPFMVFNNLYKTDIATAFRGRLVIFTVLGLLFVWVVSTIIVLCLVKNPKQRGVIIQGLYRSNFLIIGIPFTSQLMPQGTDFSPVIMLLTVIIPIYNILAVISLEGFNEKKESPLHLLLDILKNPMIYSTAVGLAFALLKIRLPRGLDEAISQLSACSSAILLFLLGCFFELAEIESHLCELIPVVLGRLIIIPAILLAIGYYYGFRGVEFVALISVFASSTAVASFTMAQQMGGDHALASSIVVSTSALCPATLCLWAMLFKALGAF